MSFTLDILNSFFFMKRAIKIKISDQYNRDFRLYSFKFIMIQLNFFLILTQFLFFHSRFAKVHNQITSIPLILYFQIINPSLHNINLIFLFQNRFFRRLQHPFKHFRFTFILFLIFFHNIFKFRLNFFNFLNLFIFFSTINIYLCIPNLLQ